MAAQLNTQTVNTNFHTPQTIYQGSGNFKLEVPQSTVMVAKPLSYDFRVVEYADNSGNITKVGLQCRIWEHDNYGSGNVVQDWTDVERVRIGV
jgi:hypothetical protein